MLKQYQNYLTKLFLKNIFIILMVFIFLSFFLNIFEEIKYFEDKENELYYPILLTILNIPSVIFEILPFIYLLGVMFFFINLYENNEIELLRSNGIDNIRITLIISTVSIITGIIIIIAYYSFSANLKSLYLNMKYKYSDAGDHLAVVNQDGLWIKEKSDDGKKIYIINAKKYKISNLENLEIIELDENYKLINTIISKKAYNTKDWIDQWNGEIIPALLPNGIELFIEDVISDEEGTAVFLKGDAEGINGEYDNDYVFIFKFKDDKIISIDVLEGIENLKLNA